MALGYDTLGDLAVTGRPYQLKMMIISGANPMVTWLYTNKVGEALSELDFSVVMHDFMAAMAGMAHPVLPACTSLEKVSTTGMSLAAMSRGPATSPFWGSWSGCKFWLELARKSGNQEYLPWRNDKEMFDRGSRDKKGEHRN